VEADVLRDHESAAKIVQRTANKQHLDIEVPYRTEGTVYVLIDE